MCSVRNVLSEPCTACAYVQVHPKMFAAQKLVDLKSFEKHWADALLHADANSLTGDAKNQFALEVINDVIFLKLVTIFSAVLDAAAIANNWIVIDRTSAKSPAAEVLIEAALKQTTSRPTILVVDSYDRLRNFKGKRAGGEGGALCTPQHPRPPLSPLTLTSHLASHLAPLAPLTPLTCPDPHLQPPI